MWSRSYTQRTFQYELSRRDIICRQPATFFLPCPSPIIAIHESEVASAPRIAPVLSLYYLVFGPETPNICVYILYYYTCYSTHAQKCKPPLCCCFPPAARRIIIVILAGIMVPLRAALAIALSAYLCQFKAEGYLVRIRLLAL